MLVFQLYNLTREQE
ncbi:hypothetical protein [Klebsiella pneumoniae]